jgi:uncharacterized SAM-binding protein YcdF (DUF218 family)
MTLTLILGAAVWPDGPSPTLRRRTGHAATLYHAGIATCLVPCGGLGRHPPTEAAAMTALLVDAGVPPEAILPEDRSTTTAENIRFALPILRAAGTTSIIIVTDWYHAPRARLIARRLGLSPQSSTPPLRGTRFDRQARMILREGVALAWTLLRGP